MKAFWPSERRAGSDAVGRHQPAGADGAEEAEPSRPRDQAAGTAAALPQEVDGDLGGHLGIGDR